MKDNRINITNDDCFNLLKKINDKSIDLILTDPPYIISKKTNFKNGPKTNDNRDRFRISMDFGDWDKNNSINWLKLFKEFFRVLKDSGTVIVFWDLWKLETLSLYLKKNNFKQIRFIEWIKTNPVPINSKVNYLTNSREIALTGVKKNKPTFNSEYDKGIYFFPIESSKHRFHPTQKSLKLFEELIKKHSTEDQLVLDCFLGGGTTAFAAINTNRRFIGSEINKDYYKKIMEILKKKKL